VRQEKVVAYDDEPLLPQGMSMQKPPEGTVRADAVPDDPRVSAGMEDGRAVERIPVSVDRALVLGGRRDYETFCTPCHGLLGDGDGAVAEKMTLRRPPSLHEARIAAEPPGLLFRTLRQGYGLMPSYGVQLSTRETWGVVAYLRALSLARGARVAELPGPIRDELVREAP
jgi:mono/diheme cytochrome c family protein